MTRQCTRAGLLLILLILLGLAGLSACKAQPVIGPLDDRASIALIRFETLEDGISGVVYRRINNFEAFLADSDVPLLVAFYDARDPVNTLVIPTLEQMADDRQGRLNIVWIDAKAQPELARSFSVERLPHFTVVVDAVLKRSMIGFGDQGAVRLLELVNQYDP